MKWKQKAEAFKALPAKKKIQYLVILLVLAVVLLLYFSTLVPVQEEESTQQLQQQLQQAETANLEEKLRSVLCKVAGAGEVDVIINYDSSAELVPALSEELRTSNDRDGEASSQTTDQSTDIATVKEDGDTTALIVKEIQPGVRGVLVVAEGAGDIGVRLQLLEAVQTFLDVEADKVEVLKMHGANS